MSRAVQTINSALVRAGLEVRRKPQQLVRSSHELGVTLEFVAAHYRSRNPGPTTVVQVGAFDGLVNDPVLDLLTRYGWSGVLIEPQPLPFGVLQARHADNPLVQVFNVAVGAVDGEQLLYALEPASDLPEWATQLASFNLQHFERQQKYMPGIDVMSRVNTLQVNTRTFDSLLRDAAVDQVDVLQVDTEGYDYEILRLFDIPRRLPAIVNYEHQHLSRADRSAAAKLLIASGYQLAMNYKGGDTVAYLS